MTVHPITVYRAGTFFTAAEPAWRTAAREFGTPFDRDWPDAVSDELNAESKRVTVRSNEIREAAVTWWHLRDGGHYAEFECQYQHVDAVLVPDGPDWLPFHVTFVLPFLQGHATIGLAHRQQEIANVLIARGRHGKGEHIDKISGTSKFDTDPRWYWKTRRDETAS